MSSDVTIAVDEGVAVLTLNRPEQLNAYTAGMGRLLSRAYLECDGDDDVRANVSVAGGRADELFVTAAQSQALLRIRFDGDELCQGR
jgi:enoyl-CoA hydratase/carnithine racemase